MLYLLKFQASAVAPAWGVAGLSKSHLWGLEEVFDVDCTQNHRPPSHIHCHCWGSRILLHQFKALCRWRCNLAVVLGQRQRYNAMSTPMQQIISLDYNREFFNQHKEVHEMLCPWVHDSDSRWSAEGGSRTAAVAKRHTSQEGYLSIEPSTSKVLS